MVTIVVSNIFDELEKTNINNEIMLIVHITPLTINVRISTLLLAAIVTIMKNKTEEL